MTEKKTSAAQYRAAQKYKREKVKRITVDFYPSEDDLVEHINAQPNKHGYIKGLIRADMAVEIELVDNVPGQVVEPLEIPERVIPEDWDI